MKGYKVTDLNGQGINGFQYQVGQTYRLPEQDKLVLGLKGFHFCQEPIDCPEYVDHLKQPLRYFEIEALGEIQSRSEYDDGIGIYPSKSVTNHIKFLREISIEEACELTTKTIVRSNGNRECYVNCILHCLNQPACQGSDGSQFWYMDGLFHRLDGPAITLANGRKEWWVEGLLHRENGPARNNISYGLGPEI